VGATNERVELQRLRERGDRQARLIAAMTGEAAARSAETARLLVETARQLGETLDPERVYDRFHELLRDTVPHDGVVVSSFDAAEDLIRCEYVWTDGRKLDPTTLPPLRPNPEGEGMQTAVIRSGETLLANDVAERVTSGRGTFYNVDATGNVRRIRDTEAPPTRAAIMAPVKHEGQVVGIVQVMSDHQTYTSEQAELVEALVGQMSAAVRNAKLYEAAQAEIAARARAERELRASEARLRATFENAAVGIAHVGLDGTWLRVNDRLCEIVGYARDELVGRTVEEHAHPDDDERGVPPGLRAGEVDHYSAERRYLHKDGREVWASVTWSTVADDAGDALHLIAVVEDISERKRSEAERRRLEAAAEAASAAARERAQAARVLAAVGDGVVLVDDRGVVRLWNPAAERIVGVAAGEIVGRRLDHVLPGWHVVSARLGTAADASSRETLPILVGESELWLSVIAVRSPDGIVYAFRDETAERALERAKSDFVATVSHELRTPLAGIYGAAVTLRRDDISLDDERRKHLLAIVTVEAERLARIVDEILVAAELESGRIRLSEEHVDLVALAEEAVASARARPESQAIAFSAPSEVPPVQGDGQKIRQVLANLLDNAVKYAPGDIAVEVACEGERVVARVRDRGPGIPPPERQRIFEKFYRLDPDQTSGVAGTGLGLYISRQLVERMGGELRLEDVDEPGATFAIALPAAGLVIARPHA
jgi:PAS domain S-box-containing protein